MQKKRSPIWTCSKKQFKDIIKKSNSVSEALSFFGLKNIGGNYNTFWSRFTHEGLDIKSFKEKVFFIKSIKKSKIIKEQILIKNSPFSNHTVKKFIKRNNIIKYECNNIDCEVKGFTWAGKQLVLQLDHINGNRTDNRIENLRFLCPNCHSQTENFAGKKLKKESNVCANCPKPISRSSKMCIECYTHFLKENSKPKPKRTKRIPIKKQNCIKCSKLIFPRKTNMCLKCYQKSRAVDLVKNRNSRKRLSYKYSQKFMNKLVAEKRKGMSYNSIAKKYSLAKSTVYYIVKNI